MAAKEPIEAIEWAIDSPLFSLAREQKREFLTQHFRVLGQLHAERCVEYRTLVNAIWGGGSFDRLEDVPFIPVRLFKEYVLKSIQDKEVFKTMTSSGTSGAQPSRIYLDRTTSNLQTKALAKIVQSVVGTSRLPMVIIDNENAITDRATFSARGAGILGFSMFGRKTFYALDAEMKLKRDQLMQFISSHRDSPILFYGFTSIIWDHFCLQLKEAGDRLNIRSGLLIHGGGWKRLLDRAVSPEVFKDVVREVCGITRVVNYYGMVEQTGSISLECERGFLHTNSFNDILIRRAADLAPAAMGEIGIIQTLSILPLSYPGYSLLTEDEGAIVGEDDCECGRQGKYFRVLGRIQQAEVRGCSDTYMGPPA